VDETFRKQTLYPGVCANFGKADFDYELVSLLEEYLESQKSPGGAAPQPGGDMPQGGGSAGGSQWVDDGISKRGTPRQLNPGTGQRRYGANLSDLPAYLSDLPAEDETAARPEHAKALRLAMLTMAELGAVHGFDPQPHLDALADLAHDPEHLGALLGSADLSWLPYHGPRGGVGAKSDTSGRIIYGKRAQAALEAQGRRGQRQASADKARSLVDTIKGGAAEDHPKHFEELAQHLPALTRAELREARKGLRATFQNGTRRDDMLRALHEHARAVVEGREPPKRKTPERGDKVGVPENPKPGKVYEVPTDDLEVDPERFQFKLNTDESGVTKELKGVKTFNPEFGGVIAAWKDPEDGKSYVVNGHHRHELASRTGHPSLAVRYIEAKTAKEARAVGALINMAEGRGTAVDAAKFMRDSGVGPEELEKRGVSLHGRLAEDATALTSLSDKTFDKLARGDLDHAKALGVAKNLPKPELQDQLFRLLDKREEAGKDLPLKVIEEMAREMGETPTHTTTESTLFGDIEDEESLFVPRNELKAAVRADLAKELNDFSAVASSRRAGAVAGAGNVLNLEENKKRADAAAEAKWTFDQLANRSGAISTALNEGAAEYAKAKGKKGRDDARAKTAERVRAAIQTELAGLRKPDAGGVGGGDEGGAAALDGERRGTADEGTGDPGTGDAKQPSLADAHRKRAYGEYEGRGVEPGSMDVSGVENGAKRLEKIEGQLKAKGWLSTEQLTGGRNPVGVDVRRTHDLLKPLVESGHLQLGWDAEGNPHYALAGAEKPGHITTDENTLPGGDPGSSGAVESGVGDRVKVPSSHTSGEFEATITDEGGGRVGLKMDNGLNAAVIPKDHLPQFLADLRGEVRGEPNTESDSVNKVLSGGAKFLGRGNDGLAFDAGDGTVVKAASILPFHWNNGTRSIEEGNRRIKSQVESNEAMRAAGVSGLVPQHHVEANGRSFAVMPKLETDGKLTPEQLGKVHAAVESAHAAGWTFGDDLQVGTDKNGEPYIFDTGAARKLSDGSEQRHDIDDDESRLSRLYAEHGHADKFHGINPEKKYESGIEQVRQTLARNQNPTSQFRDMLRKKLDRLRDDFRKANPSAAELWGDYEHEKLAKELEEQPAADTPAAAGGPVKPTTTTVEAKQTREDLARVLQGGGGFRAFTAADPSKVADAIHGLHPDARRVDVGDLFTSELRKQADAAGVDWAVVQDALTSDDPTDKRNLR
jgi:hypothetical protein